VGGTAGNASNRIANNASAGVKIEGTGTDNVVLGNSIFANNGLGTDLDNNGVTPNDPGDGDSGPNNLQNFPLLTSVTSSDGTTIQGTLDSLASTQFRIEVFANSTADSSGNGEGQTFLGFVNTTTNASGDATFSFTTPSATAAIFTATATRLDTSGNP